MVIALDHLQDPQNLGTLLRAAEACGVGLVLIPADRAAEVTPAVVNASAGAVEHLVISRVTNLARELDDLKANGWWVAGLDHGNASQNLYDAEVPTPTVIVLGAEGKGISPNVRRRCDLIVRLPMQGKIESLNAATAGSVVLFELMSRLN
jgi:23S rRNA (guanosine2251-2'-O)-methyltransferase